MEVAVVVVVDEAAAAAAAVLFFAFCASPLLMVPGAYPRRRPLAPDDHIAPAEAPAEWLGESVRCAADSVAALARCS